MNGFPFLFHDFFGGVASVGSPESWEMQWFHNFSWFLRWSGKRGKLRIIKNAWISTHSKTAMVPKPIVLIRKPNTKNTFGVPVDQDPFLMLKKLRNTRLSKPSLAPPPSSKTILRFIFTAFSLRFIAFHCAFIAFHCMFIAFHCIFIAFHRIFMQFIHCFFIAFHCIYITFHYISLHFHYISLHFTAFSLHFIAFSLHFIAFSCISLPVHFIAFHCIFIAFHCILIACHCLSLHFQCLSWYFIALKLRSSTQNHCVNHCLSRFSTCAKNPFAQITRVHKLTKLVI